MNKELLEIISQTDEIIEDRLYEQHDCPETVSKAIKDSVQLVDDRIIYLYETPRQNKFSTDLLIEKIDELTRNLDFFIILIDLHRAHRPDADTIAQVRRTYLNPKLKYCIAITGANFVINMAARFVLNSIFPGNYTVMKEKEKAFALAIKTREKFQSS